jgi:hypothetical protein
MCVTPTSNIASTHRASSLDLVNYIINYICPSTALILLAKIKFRETPKAELSIFEKSNLIGCANSGQHP